MLLKLSVNNYALIDELNIKFSSGLSIIAGETGSGKSILLGAMSLILGQRADTSVLQDKARKCIVEGEFDITGYDLNDFFDDNQLDHYNISIIRREINESGKSRAFINDTPVNLNLLKELGAKLVDIHSQHHNLILSENHFQLNVLDVIAGNGMLIDSYKQHYREYILVLDTFNDLSAKAEKATADLDYYKFQLDQLNSARLVAGEQPELEEELKLLTHAGEIKEVLNRSSALLDGEESSLLSFLTDIQSGLKKIEQYFPKISDLNQRLQSSIIEIKDISDELAGMNSITEFDPVRIGYINERLDLIYNLQQKHHVSTVDELITFRDELNVKVDEISNYEFRIEEAGKKLDRCMQDLSAVSDTLSESRKKAIPVLEEHMVNLLRQLGIPNARFVVKHHKLDQFSKNGNDKVVFMFSANRQSDPMELSRVASGGEMSRVMLSLKSLIAATKSLPTIIFDEIDSGVSGEVAGRMGNIMKNMSGHMQVVNITHLPQIAGKGDQQFLVYKEDIDNATYTRIRLLDSEERVQEIAKMLSSDGLTEAAMVNARELLNS